MSEFSDDNRCTVCGFEMMKTDIVRQSNPNPYVMLCQRHLDDFSNSPEMRGIKGLIADFVVRARKIAVMKAEETQRWFDAERKKDVEEARREVYPSELERAKLLSGKDVE